MGNSTSKDHHGAAGPHLDIFHTSPTSSLTPSLSGMHLIKTPIEGHQTKATSDGTTVVWYDAKTSEETSSVSGIQEQATVASTTNLSSMVASQEQIEVNKSKLDYLPSTVSLQSSRPSTHLKDKSKVDKVSKPGLFQEEPDESIDVFREGKIPEVKNLLKEYLTNVGSVTKDGEFKNAADVVRHLLEEREELAGEVQTLKETMKTEREEWLQFQSDLQVAVAVADRLRAEAEDELNELRGTHQHTVQQLAAAQQKQQVLSQELESLRDSHHEACRKLAMLTANHRPVEPEETAQGDVEGKRMRAVQNGRQARKSEEPVVKAYGEEKRKRGRVPWIGNKEELVEDQGKQDKAVRGDKKEAEESMTAGTTESSRKIIPPHVSLTAVNGVPQSNNAFFSKNHNRYISRGMKGEDAEQEQQNGGTYTGKLEEITSQISSSITEASLTAGSKNRPPDGFSMLLRRHGGSKRNSLLRWCQSRTQGYRNIDITNFSSSWADGLAFCAIYHTYLPSHIPYSSLAPENKMENLNLAFHTGHSMGIPASLTVEEMLKVDGPNWQRVLGYVESVYRHFEM